MSEIRYTKEQMEAITIRDKNVIVSAQAGAGKTQVLVERILTILRREKIDINSMLIVTFTNKAAAEMRDRIKKGIGDSLNNPNEDLVFFKRQYNNISNAQISTMHSFCINTIREFFYKIDINPDFKVLSQSNLEILKHQALDEVYNDYYHYYEAIKNNDSVDLDEELIQEYRDFYTFIKKYDSQKNDMRTRELIFDIYNFINSQVNPMGWIEEVKKRYYVSDAIKENEEELKKFDSRQVEKIRGLLNTDINLSIEKLEKAIYLSEKPGGPDKYKETLEDDLLRINSLKQKLESDNLDELIEHIDNYKFPRIKTISKKYMLEKDLDEDLKNQAKSLRDSYKKTIKTSLDKMNFTRQDLLESSKESYKTICTIEKILFRFDKKYKDRKREAKGIDFSDAEHLTIELLEDSDVVNNLRQRYNYIFFDEYQDANQIQNHIVEKIRRQTNLFFVGDIKQSIYKFRLADPNLFHKRYESYKRGDKVDRAIDLNKNFRSRRELLEFNNFIFNKLMTKRLGEVDYRSPSHQLVSGGEFPDISNAVDITYILRDKKDIESLELMNPGLLYDDNESYYVAKRIRYLVDNEGYSYKDFAILVRTKSNISQIEEDLSRFEIEFYSDSYEVNFSNLEVLNYINILKAIDNDQVDLTLLSVLLLPISNFTEEDIARIKLTSPQTSFHYAFYKFKDNMEENNIQDLGILEKINDYYEKLSHYRSLEKTMTLFDFAWYIFEDSGYRSFLLSSISGREKVDNVIAFIEEVNKFQDNHKVGLYGFLTYVDDLMKKEKSSLEPGANLSEEDDVVRIMTIHKSKGLQFKNVFLLNMSRQFSQMDLRKEYLYHNELGLALKEYNYLEHQLEENLDYLYIRNQKRKEAWSEEVRVLYVALTRAIDRLFLVGTVDENFYKKEYLSSLEEYNNYMDWLSAILLKDKVSDKFKSKSGLYVETNSDYFDLDMKNKIQIQIIEEKDIILEKDSSTILKKEDLDLDLADKLDIDYILDYEYPYMEYTQVGYKKTVSQLSSQNNIQSSDLKDNEYLDKKYIHTDLEFNEPNFLKDKSLMTPTELGSLIHKVFQYIEIKNYDKDSIKEEKYRLVQLGILEEEEADYIDWNIFIEFFSSSQGRDIIENKSSVRREEAFTMKYKDQDIEILIDGQIDLYYEKDKEIIVIDFKTNSRLEEDLYVKQMSLYKEGLEKALDKPVKSIFIYWTQFNHFSKMF